MFWVKLWAERRLLTAIAIVVTMIFVSFVLRSRRSPGSMMAWILFLLAIPYIAIPLYLIITERKLKRDSPDHRPSFKSNCSTKEFGCDAGVAKLFLNLGVPPTRPIDHVELVQSGQSALDAMLELIRSAEKSIHITVYIFANDKVGRQVLHELERKAHDGVEVRVLVDTLGLLWTRKPSFKKLKQLGGKVKYFMPLLHNPFKGRTNLRNHRKMIAIDGHTAFVGGMNIAVEYQGPKRKRWIDLALKMRGEGVLDLEEIFERDWNYAANGIPPKKSKVSSHKGPSDVQFIASGPDVPNDALYDFYLSSIYRAEKRVWIATPYFIPDESLNKALELAARRGVEVRIWLPEHSDHWLLDVARRTYIRHLLSSGIGIEFVSKILHGKAVVIDDSYAIVGSANFDMRSLIYNYELEAVVFSEREIHQIEHWFRALPAHRRESWPRENAFWILVEGVGRMMGPLL